MTAELLWDSLPAGVGLIDLGEHRLRDLDRSEHVFQLRLEGLPSEFAALRTLSSAPNNLPIQPTTFVGRAREMVEIRELIRRARLVSLTGVGGSGKTRLALQIGADLVDEFADGVWWVELAPLTDPQQVVPAVARVVGAVERQAGSMLPVLIHHLRVKQLLLILDNCEHVIGVASELAAAVLAAAPGVKVMATTRELLGVDGEAPFAVGSLAMPTAADRSDLEELLTFDALRLFEERAAVARPGFHLSSETAPAVLEICLRLDGLALALELAASRLRSFSPEQIASHLDQRFRMLTGGSRTALPRHQTLQATIDWSYALLDGAERALFQRLAVFRGGFTLDAARDVCAQSGLDELDVIEILPRLIDKSLVVFEPSGRDPRYRLLETLRQYAQDRLVESGEVGIFRARHAEFFQALSEEAVPFLRMDDDDWANRLEREVDNLRQALQWSIDGGDVEAGMRIAGNIYRFWRRRRHVREGREWIGRLLLLEGEASTAVRSRFLIGAGVLGFLGGDLDEAVAWLAQAVEGLRSEVAASGGQASSGLFHDLCTALVGLGAATGHALDYERMERITEEALELARRLDFRSAIATCLNNLGDAAADRGEIRIARARYREALEVARTLRSPALFVELSMRDGRFERIQGDPEEALHLFQEAASVAGGSNDPILVARFRVQMGMAHLALGSLDRAIELFLPNAEAAARDREFQATGREFAELVLDRAVIDLAFGEVRRAGRMLGMVDRLLDTGRYFEHITLSERAGLEGRLAAALGDAELDRARREGRGAREEEIIRSISEPIER